ncbi:hypothetical protein HN011_002352 [Eciton burchellii]|nr:hypothetical protein HN011_002352 [Eciton burchellii]
MTKKKIKAYVKRKPIPERKIIESLVSKYSTIDVLKTKKFNDLPLSRNTLKGLTECDYVEMTDIQRQSIGYALQGKHIVGAAKTGSGKTLAFLIPVLERLYCQQWTRLDGVGALIITPTRELAYQIYETLRKIGLYHNISAGLIIGGKDLKFEKRRMDQCNIIICTPGRLLQHMDENPLFNCVNMQILVLDEADRCLDMGFQNAMNSIIDNLPLQRQTLLFSATQTRSVEDLLRLNLKDALYVSVHEHSAHTTPEGLRQSYIVCALEDKIAMLWSFIRNHLKQKIIVFFSSCKQVKYVYEAFCRLRPGISLLALYGSLHQLRRMNIYESFCKKQHAVLFATDIAARGLDFPTINWVLQMDCPEDVNTYIHRAGRTARFKNGGESLLVLLPSEEKILEGLKQRKIPINMIQINPNKLQSPHRKLEALLAANVTLKESAQRAFVAYIKSVFLMKNKEIFDVRALNIERYANSLGLAVPPRVRFLQRMQKKMATNDIKKETNETILANASEQESSEDNSDTEEISNTTNKKKIIKKEDAQQFDVSSDNDDDDDVLAIKRKNIDIDDIPINVKNDDKKKVSKKKPVTKVAMAKKILKKKIVPNKKITFDEDGQELINSATTKMSELGRQYENELDSGINIEIAKQILREEDQFDKERFKEKLREKRREEKRKLKAARRRETDEGEDMGNDNEDGEEGEFEEDECSEDESGEGPDLSWLPDPDKIYGKQKNSDEEASASESEEDEESEEDSMIHRPSKRKLVTQEEHNQMLKQKKRKILNVTDLQVNEELALQLLQN